MSLRTGLVTATCILFWSTACTSEGEPTDATENRVERGADQLSVQRLTISPEIPDDEERTNLSGAACAPDGQCLLVGDEKRYARLFRIVGEKLIPGDPLYLLPDRDAAGKETKESDAEGIAFNAGHFYIIGSHSNSKKAKVQPSRHFLARIPLGMTSAPDRLGTPSEPAASLTSVSLDSLIDAEAAFKPYLKHAAGEFKPGEAKFAEDQHGVNIEGLAVTGDSVFVGFRGPVSAKGAFLYELKLSELFEGATLSRKPHLVPLGATPDGTMQGIRDLAAVSGGLLILAGPEMRADPDSTAAKPVACARACPQPELYFWKAGLKPKRIAELGDRYRGDSPEAITVLEETDAAYRILILSDGEGKSDPLILVLPKPK